MILSSDIMQALMAGAITREIAHALQTDRDTGGDGRLPAPPPVERERPRELAPAPAPLVERERPRELPAVTPSVPPRHAVGASIAGIYTPYSPTGDLGSAYNRIMGRLQPGEWAVFLDHDAMILSPEYWSDLHAAIEAHPAAGAIACWSNRVGNPAQKAKAPDTDDIAAHTKRAAQIRAEHGLSCTDISSDRMTGVCFAVSRAAWELAGPFAPGFGEVDNSWARQCRAKGLPIIRMDGQYIYHQRRTNGWKRGPSPDSPCRQTAWQWQTARSTLAAAPQQTIRVLYTAHTQAVESRTDWTECQKNARRKVLLSQWQQAMTVALVIPARNEQPERLAATVQTWRDGGADTILVIDDASDIPLQRPDGVNTWIRHTAPIGVAPSRNEGLACVDEGVVIFADSHCPIVQGDLRAFAWQALLTGDLMIAGCQGNHRYHGASLKWDRWRWNVSGNAAKTEWPHAPFGSVYAARRSTWDQIGGWVPTAGFGYNEQSLALACRRAGVRMRVDFTFACKHHFRKTKNGRRTFPYTVSGLDFAANSAWAHYLLFEPELWERVFKPLAAKYEPRGLKRCMERIADRGPAERERYRALRRASDSEILHALGALRLMDEVTA